jgi:RNA polymerase sigma factor (sigma-70 family)
MPTGNRIWAGGFHSPRGERGEALQPEVREGETRRNKGPDPKGKKWMVLSNDDEHRWNLIRRAADGDAHAREQFVEAYAPVIRATMTKLRWGHSPTQDIDDAIQDTFVDLLRPRGALERFDPKRCPSFLAYLRGVVRNIARRRARQASRARERQVQPAVIGRIPSLTRSASRAHEVKLAEARVRTAWKRWARSAKNEYQRLRVWILEQRFHEGKGIAEMARDRGLCPAVVDYHYRFALRELRKTLRKVIREQEPSARVDEEILSIFMLLG